MVALAPNTIRVPVSAVVSVVLFFALLSPGTAPAQILPWEVVVAQIETGRLRNFAERLAKQNLLYQLRIGDTRKSDLVETAEQIDRIIESLERGNSSYSVPAPWTAAIREQIERVDDAWGPVRSVATSSPYDYFKVRRQFAPAENRAMDPFLLRYFDVTTQSLIEESERLLDLYYAECVETGLEVCAMAKATGINAMLIERATKQAIYVVAGIDAGKNREGLSTTLDAYRMRRQANEGSQFFADALNPERSVSSAAGAELLINLRGDWDQLRKEFTILAAGDEKNFDLRRLLSNQARLVDKVERLTAALVRYASVTYGI
jgi:hypothetical protein